MLLMIGRCECAAVSHAIPHVCSGASAFNQTPVRVGRLSLHYTIQPVFTFRWEWRCRTPSRSHPQMLGLCHRGRACFWRALLPDRPRNFPPISHIRHDERHFEDTLTQTAWVPALRFSAGLYTSALWAVDGARVVLVGYGERGLSIPPGPHFHYAARGVPPDWHPNFTISLALEQEQQPRSCV